MEMQGDKTKNDVNELKKCIWIAAKALDCELEKFLRDYDSRTVVEQAKMEVSQEPESVSTSEQPSVQPDPIEVEPTALPQQVEPSIVAEIHQQSHCRPVAQPQPESTSAQGQYVNPMEVKIPLAGESLQTNENVANPQPDIQSPSTESSTVKPPPDAKELALRLYALVHQLKVQMESQL